MCTISSSISGVSSSISCMNNSSPCSLFGEPLGLLGTSTDWGLIYKSIRTDLKGSCFAFYTSFKALSVGKSLSRGYIVGTDISLVSILTTFTFGLLIYQYSVIHTVNVKNQNTVPPISIISGSISDNAKADEIQSKKIVAILCY